MSKTLYIDANEPLEVQRRVREEIEKRDDLKIDVETEGLKTGDFVFGNVVIERKEKSDLHGSVTDGRAKKQTSRMSADFEHGYVLVEGDPYHQEYSNLHPNSITGTLVSMTARKKLFVVPVQDTDSLAYAIYKICRVHENDEDFEADEYELKRSGADTEDIGVAMLTQIKGISKNKAEKILEDRSFNSLVWHITSEKGDRDGLVESLRTIDGVGRKLSKRIVESFTQA